MAVNTADQSTEENLVDNFTWDETDDGIFTPPVVKTKTQEQQDVLNKVKNKDVEVTEEDETESEHEFFEDQETETTKGSKGKTDKDKKTTEALGKDTDPEEEDDSDQKDDFFKTLALEMKEKNIFTSIEIGEEDDVDEDKFFEFQEAELQARVDDTFKGIFDELNNDPDAVAFLQHKRAGGDTYSFFKTYGEATTLPANLDLTQPANQKKVLEYYYLNVEKIDEEDLEDKLEFLTEKGKTEVYAKKYYKEISDKDTATKLKLATDQEKTVEQANDRAKELRVKLQAVLDKGEGVGSFKFTSEEKKNLLPAVTKATVKVGPNQFITPFQAKIREIMRDEKKMLTLAKIVMPDFDLPDLKKTVTTEVTKGVRSKLEEQKKNKTNRTTSVSEKSLADLISS